MGSRIASREVWAEMARRKIRFHPTEEWNTIHLWGLFTWGGVRHLLEKGLLLTDMRKENVTIWVRPSQEAWEQHVKPLVERHSPEELTSQAA